jgi:NAD(P)-dependent dehydrogenase (short-subunit alcohol dehydrogenase family)
MADEFLIQPNFGLTFRTFLHSQFFGTPPYPTHSFAGQTIIVTGSNVGLGFEAARHFYRLNCARLILAVRTVSKGQTAKEDIVRSVRHRTDGAEAIEVWPLDLTSTASTLSFAEKVKSELDRVDVVVENAGIATQSWHVTEGFESVIQVNVINTLLLALCLLPKLTETKNKFPDSTPHLEIVSSEVHHFTKFPQANTEDIYQTLNDEKAYNGLDR